MKLVNELRDYAKDLTKSNFIAGAKLVMDAAFQIERLWEIVDEHDKQTPAPLFTRTAYNKEELFAHIDSLEQLGFTSYVIGRDVSDVQDPIVRAMGAKSKDRWIIKVYGTDEVE